MRSPQVNGSIMEKGMKTPGFNCWDPSCYPSWAEDPAAMLERLRGCSGQDKQYGGLKHKLSSLPSSFFLSAKHHLRVLVCNSFANSPTRGWLCFKQSSSLQPVCSSSGLVLWWLRGTLSWRRSLGCPQPSHVLSARSLPGTQHLLLVTLVACAGFSSVY